MIATTRTLFFTMVLHPVSGWMRVGNAYGSMDCAKTWLPLVRGAWRGLRVKVSRCTIRMIDGKLCEGSLKVLSEKYNLDAPTTTTSATQRSE